MVEDFQVFAAMERFGGRFVKSLAMAFRVADAENTRRLKLAFPEYWEEYSTWAENLAKRPKDVNEGNEV